MNINFEIMKKIKFRTFAAVIITCLVTVACVQDDDFTIPSSIGNEENENLTNLLSRIEAGEVQLITIDQLKAQFISDDEATEIASEIAVKGYVSSSDATGNFYKEFFIQDAAEDATSAIKISLNQVDSYNQFNMGREVYIYLKDLYLGEANGGDGVYTIGGAMNSDGEVEALTANEVPMYLFRSDNSYTIVPKAVSALSSNDVGIFVTLNDVEFTTSGVGQPYVSPTDDYDTQRTIQRCTGFNYSTFLMETSAFASFKNEILPSGGGSISGVVSKDYYGDNLVLALNTSDDVLMDGSRCELLDINDFTEIISEDFQSAIHNTNLDFPGWTNFAEEGGWVWRERVYSGNGYTEFSTYNSPDDVNIAWLISPGVDLDAQENEFLNFKMAQHHLQSDLNTAEVFISTNFDGSNVLGATWIPVSANLPSQSNSWYQFVDSGLIDLSSYSGTLHVAFKVTGSGTDQTLDGAYQLDDFTILGQQ